MREFIVEADGGSRGNPGPAGYGSVVLDAVTGETLVEAAEYIGVATNNVAEYRGLIAGLKAARELDPVGAPGVEPQPDAVAGEVGAEEVAQEGIIHPVEHDAVCRLERVDEIDAP